MREIFFKISLIVCILNNKKDCTEKMRIDEPETVRLGGHNGKG